MTHNIPVSYTVNISALKTEFIEAGIKRRAIEGILHLQFAILCDWAGLEASVVEEEGLLQVYTVFQELDL